MIPEINHQKLSKPEKNLKGFSKQIAFFSDVSGPLDLLASITNLSKKLSEFSSFVLHIIGSSRVHFECLLFFASSPFVSLIHDTKHQFLINFQWNVSVSVAR